MDAETARARLEALVHLPGLVEGLVAKRAEVEALAARYVNARDFLYLGRGENFPIALEGALKLKEISYIHAEGYAAGEMKHGPIALIDSDMPVVVIANKSPVYDKVISNLEQVRSRDGVVIAIATEGDTEIAEKANEVIYIPDLGEAVMNYRLPLRDGERFVGALLTTITTSALATSRAKVASSAMGSRTTERLFAEK